MRRPLILIHECVIFLLRFHSLCIQITNSANPPKRGQSAYVLWLAENRANITEQAMSASEFAKKAGQLWRDMTVDEKTVRSDWLID